MAAKEKKKKQEKDGSKAKGKADGGKKHKASPATSGGKTKAESKASGKKATQKNMAKKTASKPAAKPQKAKAAPAKKQAAKTEKKPAKPVEKKAPAPKAEKPAKAAKAVEPAKGKGAAAAKTGKSEAAKPAGVTVQIGGSKPALAIAPGAMLMKKAPERRKSGESDPDAGRKLTKKELSEIREMLLEKREKLLHGVRREIAAQRARSDSKSMDEADRAADAYDEDLTLEITSNSDEALSQIETSLGKIEDGTYGQCEECGCQISISRLRILPFATACRDCRMEHEKNRQHQDGGAAAWGATAADEPEEEEAEEE